MRCNSNRNFRTRVTSTVVIAGIVVGAICLGAVNGHAQLMNTGWGEAPSPMAALLTDPQPQPQHQVVSLALGHQFFVPNEGQWSDATVQYGLHADNWSIAFRDGGAIELILRKAKPEPAGPEPTMRPMEAMGLTHNPMDSRPTQFDQTSVTLTFPGCNAAAKPVGIHPTPTKVNYFVGGNDRESAAGLATYTVIEYPNLYNGIDLFIRGNEIDGTIKYEFHVAAGADTSLIRMHYEGLNTPLTLNSGGDLQIPTDLGTLTDHAPIAYQGSKKVQATYMLIGNDSCRVSLGDGYDPAQPVVIDPDVEWMTYLGGSDDDEAHGIAVDSAGSVLVSGWTRSTDFENRNNAFHGGDSDVFVAKVSNAGILQWMTYLGGSDTDEGFGIALDGVGDALVSGWTDSSDFEGRNNAYHGGGQFRGDAIIAKVDGGLGTVQWMTYIGGSDDDQGYSIAVDSTGSALVAGNTYSDDFAGHINAIHGENDMFVVKVSTSGGLQWMSYLGGSGSDSGVGIAVDGNNDLLVTGYTNSPDFDGRNNEYHGDGSRGDAAVVKLNDSGDVAWMTYLGGSGIDTGYAITADNADNALVTGDTMSRDFDGRNNTYHDGTPFADDAFVVKVTTGGALQWMTYLGGSDWDEGYNIAMDNTDNYILLTGWTSSADFDGFQNVYHGSGDAFIIKVNASGILQWMLYLGGSQFDTGSGGIAVDSTHEIALVAGVTDSTDFEGRNNSYHGSQDAFIVKVRIVEGPQLSVDASCPAGGPIEISWSGATPHEHVALLFGREEGATVIPEGNPCAGTLLNLHSHVKEVLEGLTGSNGSAIINGEARPGACGGVMQLLDLTTCATSNVAPVE